MGLIKEPLNVDFYFNGKQMNDTDQQRVTAFIKQQKELKKAVSPKKKSKRKQNA